MSALRASAAPSSFLSGPYLEGLMRVVAGNGMTSEVDEPTADWIGGMCRRIVARRLELGLHPADVAARLSATGPRILEAGYKKWEVKGPPLTPGTSRLAELAAALECQPDWILHGDIQQAPSPRLAQGSAQDQDVEELAVVLGELEVRLAGIEAAIQRLEPLNGKQGHPARGTRPRKPR